jgi:hypothetical protein
MKRLKNAFLKGTFLISTLLLSMSVATPTSADESALNDLMEGFHAAASKGDFDDYFGRFASQSVFLGTDASERWPLDDFKAYAKPHFDAGRGWTYQTVGRHWRIEGNIAWFDEQLDNESLGRCRGTGVVILEGGEWKVAHYSLTLLIPNEIADEVAEKSKQATQSTQNNGQ